MVADKRLAEIVPHERQIKFQQTEFYAFVHFTVNTFTDREWGSGTESPDIFYPVKFDAEQWVKAIVSAEMKGLILTCKHHDGFCLWHSKLTEHTVEYSPFKRDIVREVADACKKYGIKFGVYLSPWDRHSPLYGSSKDYDDYFIGQLTELLTYYGNVFSVWFDGVCGEGPNGKKQYYDWERYYKTIRELQPEACINVCGPDVRWCGNEAGHTRKAADITYNGKDIRSQVLSDSYDDYFVADTAAADITIKWNVPQSIGNIILKENIRKSQQVEHFCIETLVNGSFEKIYENTVIGYKRIIRLDNIRSDCFRIKITDSRTEPTLAFIGIYKGE